MTNEENILFMKTLAVGLLAAVGKLLAGNEALTLRKVIGRAITGAITAVSCFSVFLHNESVGELTIIGLAALVGILGSSTIEYFIVTFFDKKIIKKGQKDD